MTRANYSSIFGSMLKNVVYNSCYIIGIYASVLVVASATKGIRTT